MTHQELFESAVDLFAGAALVWYRSSASRIHSWIQLSKELREVFQPPDYDFRLHQEFFNRVQGEQEYVDLYIAAMEGLYGRLSTQIPEASKLAQIYNNLHPQLQDRLALFDIKTLEELRFMGRRAEAGRLRRTRPRTYPRSDTVLEPDLAYQDTSRRRRPPAGIVASVRESLAPVRPDITCWNCQRLSRFMNHRFMNCRNPRKKFCYGCGGKDIIKKDCPKCNPKKLVKEGASRLAEADSRGPQNTIKIDYALQTQSRDPRPYLTIRIFGREIKALLDSGASHTILGSKAL